MMGSNTQLLQVRVQSDGNYAKRIRPKSATNRGKGASCAFPDVMLSMHDQSKNSHTVKKSSEILLESLKKKKVSVHKGEVDIRDLQISSDTPKRNRHRSLKPTVPESPGRVPGEVVAKKSVPTTPRVFETLPSTMGTENIRTAPVLHTEQHRHNPDLGSRSNGQIYRQSRENIEKPNLSTSHDISVKDRKKIENIPNPRNRVEANHVIDRKSAQATRIGEYQIPKDIKSTVYVKHPAFKMPLMENAWWEMADVKTTPSKSAQVVNPPGIQSKVGDIYRSKNIHPLYTPRTRLTTPMTSLESRMWGGMNELLAPEVVLNDGNEKSEMLLNARNSVIPNRVAQYAYGSTTNNRTVPKMQNKASGLTNSPPAQKPVTSNKGAKNSLPNTTAEQVQSNVKEALSTATSTDTSKVAKEAVGVNNARNASSEVGKSKKNIGKTKGNAFSQRNGNIKTSGKGKSEVSVNIKHSAKSHAPNQKIPEMENATEKGAKPKVGVLSNGMKSPMMWFEARMWSGMDDLLSKPGIMAKGGQDRYGALLHTRNSVLSDRVAQNAYGSTTNSKLASKVQDIALTLKDHESAQKPVANEKGTQNPASNPNAEPLQSNGKETPNIATSTDTLKVAKETVGANIIRNTSSKASFVVSKGKKNTGKTKSGAFLQQNNNIKARSRGKSEAALSGKQAAKQQVPNQEISDMVMAAEKGAKPKVGVQIDGVASPNAGITSSSNGQAVPVDTVPAQSHSRWDSLMRFVQRIMQNARIQHRHEGLSELRVRMVSETLGKLMVHISVSDNHVDVRFALDTPQARQMMHLYKAELAQILKDSGASTVNIDVSTSSADGEGRFRKFSEADDRYGHRTFNSQVPIDNNWDYPEDLDQEDELASPVNTVNFPHEHSSMVWVA